MGAVRREVGEEARVLPVHEAGHDDAVDIGEHCSERLDLRWGVLGELAADVARPDVGRHRQLLDRVEVAGDPVDELVPGPAELLRRHARQSAHESLLQRRRMPITRRVPMAISPTTITANTAPWRHPPRSLLPQSGRCTELMQSVKLTVVSSGRNTFSMVVVGAGVSGGATVSPVGRFRRPQRQQHRHEDRRQHRIRF